MQRDKIKALVEDVAKTIIEHAEELTDLDQAIGDGDHGINMKRGFDAVLAGLDAELDKSLADVLKYVGMTLVMKVGGASGPLYGTLFLTLGKELAAQGDAASEFASLTPAFAAAIDAVQRRGKSEPGQKTMLDVLVPLRDELARADSADDLPGRLAQCAQDAADATIPLRATRGRASFLGDRSIGHMDPGARSSALMIASICKVLGGSHA